MSMRFIRRSSMLLGAAAVLCSFGSMSAEAATIVPTGGSFGNMKPTETSRRRMARRSAYSEITYLFDDFGQNPYLITSTASEVSTTVTADSLSLSGVARSFYDATHFDVVSGSRAARSDSI